MTSLAEPKIQLSVVRPEIAPAERSGWRRARKGARWLATAALIGWLASSADWHAVGLTFATASIPWLLLAAGVYLASQLASALRWELLVRAAGLVQSRWRLLAAYFEGMFVNVCLPTTVGGDVLKVLRVGGSQHKRVAISTVIANRASGLAALLALLTAGLLLKMGNVGLIAAPLLVVAVIAALHTAATLLRTGIVSSETAGSESGNWALRQLKKVMRFVPMSVRHLAIQAPWGSVMVWAFVVQVLNVVAVAVAARSIGIDVSPIEILVATMTVSLVTALPISIAGVGVREASLPMLLASDGVPRNLAIALGIAWSGIVLVVGLVGGPIHFFGQRSAIGEQKSAATAPPIATRRSA